MNIIIESLRRDKHHRLAFRCGVESLDAFLQSHAFQAFEKRLLKTYVAVDRADETTVLGYYTVATSRIQAGELPPVVLRKFKLPQHDIPASLVARLAVTEAMKGQGVGGLLLMDAMARCARVSNEIGGVAIVVDAQHEGVASFYEQFGFRRFEPDSLRLFIMMKTVQAIVGLPEEQRDAG